MSEKKISYCDVVKEFIRDLEKRTSEAINTASEPGVATRELKKVSGEIQLSLMEAGELRFLLKNQEKRMNGLIRGVNKKLRELGEMPESVFYHPKTKVDNDPRTIVCPYCRRENKDFTWGLPCKYCGMPIHSPWKETVQCPKCHAQFLRKDIFDDQSAYELEDGAITCYLCFHRLKWKENVIDPEVYGAKTCSNCDLPFIPGKYNWKKQRLCSACKDKGINLFDLDNPEYQKGYREEKKKENRKKVTRK